MEQETAVWRKVIEILSTEYMSKDSAVAAKAIQLDDGAVVPEEVLQRVLDIIQTERIAPATATRRRVMGMSFDDQTPALPAETEAPVKTA